MNEIFLSEEQMYFLKRMASAMFGKFDVTVTVPHDCGGCYVAFGTPEGGRMLHWLEFCLFYLQPTLQVYISSYVIRTMGAKYVNLLYERFKYSNYASNQRIEELRFDKEGT